MGKNYEILAPAGSEEQLVAAVNNGCDAVYLGLDSFNARMKAPNFTTENLGRWVDFCHFFGVKVYVTVNTSVKNAEFSAAKSAIFAAYKNNADGVIVTDLALLRFAATLPKPFDVVASTQLNAHDGFGARFLKQLGATTVVCARESSYDEISQVVAEGVNTECFLHGALCVCQSGQCLFSSMVGGNSGNRGLCAQPCRKLYKSNGSRFVDGGYLLSAADICGLNTAKRLHGLGVSTFKIEGRNRRAEYAGAASRVYSRLFANNFRATHADEILLKEMFNRGGLPDCAYLAGRNDGVIYPSVQNHIGVSVGQVRGKHVFAEVQLTKGDGLKIIDAGREVCGAVVLQSGKGLVPVDFSGKVRNGMTVCRTSSVALTNEILSAKRTLDVSLNLVAQANRQAVLTLSCGDVTVSVASADMWPKGLKTPTNGQELAQQLSKTGVFCYTITDIVLQNDDIFATKAQINALRRDGFAKLQQAITDQYNAQFANRQSVNLEAAEQFDLVPSVANSSQKENSASRKLSAVPASQAEPSTKGPCLAVICYNLDQLQQASGADYLIFKPEIITQNALDNAAKYSNVFVDLPSFSDNNYLKGILANCKIGLVCHNVGHVQLARELGLHYIAGTGLNIFNDQMAAVFADAETFFYSQELTLSEIASFRNHNGLTFVDGDLVLMKLVHCPFKVAYGCDCSTCQSSKKLVYTDELGNEFVLRRRRDSRCSFELVNGKKLSVANRLKAAGRYCIDFDEKAICHYKNLNNGTADDFSETRPYTKGRLFNKIN